jgi:CBS domain-containing protein
MLVSDAMTSDVKIASPNQSISDAARMMAQLDTGMLPVGENDRLVGVITDRDIAVRAVAAGKLPSTPVRDVMSAEVRYCFEDDELETVTRNMADVKLRRLPVLNEEKRLVGIISLGDIALTDGPGHVGTALCGIWSRAAPTHSRWMVTGARCADVATTVSCLSESPQTVSRLRALGSTETLRERHSVRHDSPRPTFTWAVCSEPSGCLWR